MRILFFGTTTFAARIFESLVAAGYACVGVVTRPDKPQGRGQKIDSPPVKLVAQKILPGIPVYQPIKASSDEAFIASIQKLKSKEDPLLFVVVAYGEILKQNLLDMPDVTPYGAINIHASLLPKYRGAAPIHRALQNGEQESGVTIIEMVREMDAGAMLGKAIVEIGQRMTFPELEEVLCAAACTLLPQVLAQIESAGVDALAQNPADVTFAAKITPEEYRIDWSKGARDIDLQIRSLRGSYCLALIDGKEMRLKILEAHPDPSLPPLSPGEMALKEGLIGTGTCPLKLLRIQLEGKPPSLYKEFVNGYSDRLNKIK